MTQEALSIWEKGLCCCDSCKAELSLSSLPPLELSACPECGKQLFAPMKIKDYWLCKPLGGGGMGSVFKSIHCTEKAEFAVKILPRGKKDVPGLRENLLREAEAGAKLGTHPHIVPVLDYGEENGECFMVTAFAAGERLDNLVEHEHQLPESRALQIMREILEAETHIVSAGYLYRDMKPQNIMICPDGSAKLFDYGLCLPLEEAANPKSSDELEGSPFYLPPERVVGAAEGEYSEIYSMGMVLFFMMSGRSYYSEAEITDLVNKHLTSLRIASVANQLKQCRAETVSMLDRMIARNPNNRYHDFASLAEALDTACELAREHGKTISAPASEPVERKPRNPKPLLIGSAALAILLGAYFIWSSLAAASAGREARAKIAAELGISPEQKAPDTALSELKKQAEKRATSIFEEKRAAAERAFNETAERAAILKELRLSDPLPSPPEKSEAELKKMAEAELKRLIDAEKAKRSKLFSEEDETKRLAESLKISLPANPPSKSLAEVQKDFDESLAKQIDEKYPSKALSQEKMKIMKQYPLCKIGDKISVSNAGGKTISGTFKGISEGKVLIDDTRVPLMDIGTAELWRFDDNVNTARIDKAITAATESFNNARAELKAELEKKSKDEFFRENGYILLDKRWVAIPDYLKTKLNEAKKKSSANSADSEKKFRTELEKNFDPKAFYVKSGYQNLKNAWLPAAKAVNAILQERKTKALADPGTIKEAALQDAEKEIYPKHGYLFIDGKWQPAKDVLDSRVKSFLAKGK